MGEGEEKGKHITNERRSELASTRFETWGGGFGRCVQQTRGVIPHTMCLRRESNKKRGVEGCGESPMIKNRGRWGVRVCLGEEKGSQSDFRGHMNAQETKAFDEKGTRRAKEEAL